MFALKVNITCSVIAVFCDTCSQQVLRINNYNCVNEDYACASPTMHNAHSSCFELPLLGIRFCADVLCDWFFADAKLHISLYEWVDKIINLIRKNLFVCIQQLTNFILLNFWKFLIQNAYVRFIRGVRVKCFNGENNSGSFNIRVLAIINNPSSKHEIKCIKTPYLIWTRQSL